MMRNPDDGWTRLEDGDARLRRHLHPEQPKGHINKVLYIYKNQLMYDIDAQVSMITTMRRNEKGIESNAQSEMLDRYKGMFDRWIDNHVEKVKEQLILAVMDSRNYSSGDELRDWSEKEIRLSFPYWWDDTAWNPLIKTVHDYIVNAVLTEFFKITLSSSDPITITKSEDADNSYAKIKVLLCQHKAGSIKKPLRTMGF